MAKQTSAPKGKPSLNEQQAALLLHCIAGQASALRDMLSFLQETAIIEKAPSLTAPLQCAMDSAALIGSMADHFSGQCWHGSAFDWLIGKAFTQAGTEASHG